MTTMNERDLYYGQRLAEMIRCKTVSHKEGFEPEEFLKLRRVIGTLFPLVTEKAERTILGKDAYLYKLPGKDPSRNVLLMSHHDVVEATGSWQEAPFAGVIRDGKLWGRGTGSTPRRRCLRKFSALEGAAARGLRIPGERLPVLLPQRGVQRRRRAARARLFHRAHASALTGSATEGGAVIAPPMPGIDKKCAMIAVHEKGRCTAQLIAEPQQGTRGLPARTRRRVMRMAAFMTEVDEKKPFIRRLHPEVRGMFEALAPHMAFPMRTVFSNLGLFSGLLIRLMPKLNAAAGEMLGTGCTFKNISTDDDGHLPGAGISALHQRRGLRKRSRHPAQDGRVPRRADRPA